MFDFLNARMTLVCDPGAVTDQGIRRAVGQAGLTSASGDTVQNDGFWARHCWLFSMA